MRGRRSGVSLLEAMVTVGLISLTLAITAGLMRMYSQGSRLVGVRDTGFQGLEAILYTIRSETMGAVDFQSPATTGPTFSSVLEFRRVDRHNSGRLTNFPTNWTPYDIVGTPPSQNFLLSIRYRVQDQTLIRDVRPAGASSFESTVMIPADILSLKVRRNPDQTMELELEVQGSRKTRLFRNRFLRRVP
jgi:type II secretory pathway component PulJ